MRHNIFLISATSLLLALTACGDSNSSSSSNNQTATKQTEETTKQPPVATTTHIKPSFDCSKADIGGTDKPSTETIICQKPELSKLDSQLDEVYQQALQKSGTSSQTLKAMQRGWIKGRNDCWKSEEQVSCIKNSYLHRISELQARYQLVDSKGPFRFVCENNPKNEFIITFYDTEPATLIAERGDQESLMHSVVSASGSKYQGRNEIFWEHQGEATITWGYEAPELTCKKHP